MAGARSAAAGVDDSNAAEPVGRTGTLRQLPTKGAWAGQKRAEGRARSDRLSGKERAVLAELARGNSTEEIGMILSVSPHTVRTHVKNLMRKLDARTRAHAVAIALADRAIDV
jgi:DNA-binding CsgD family transcriptional regulator